jgi:hypothetical protein
MVTVAVSEAPVSTAHTCVAPSIFLKLAIQASCWAFCLALTKFGMAIAANKPIIATTIIISTSVKPFVLIFIIILYHLPFAQDWGCFSKKYIDLFHCLFFFTKAYLELEKIIKL